SAARYLYTEKRWDTNPNNLDAGHAPEGENDL
ncbi:MAG: hypothetical protein ACI9J0_003990, partial [Cryomorphaceae bacterium]